MADGLVKTIGEMNLYVRQGDITQIPTDAVMTAINSEGMWFGGVDGAIQRAAGNTYHQQAAQAMPLKNLDTVLARGDQDYHHGQFDNVVFVVDDLQSPLNEVVYKGLEAASNAGYESLLMPAIRMGVMAGAVERTPEETISKLGEGILTFMADYGSSTSIKELTFVVYSDPQTMHAIEGGLKLLPTIN